MNDPEASSQRDVHVQDDAVLLCIALKEVCVLYVCKAALVLITALLDLLLVSILFADHMQCCTFHGVWEGSEVPD